MALAVNALTTLASAKTYFGICDTSQDALLESLINFVSDDIAHRCNRTFNQSSQTQSYKGSGAQELLLDIYPVTAVASVVIDGDTVDNTGNADYEIIGECGILLRKYAVWPLPGTTISEIGKYYPEMSVTESKNRRNISVTYTGGYIMPGAASPLVRNLPYDLEMACLKMVAYDMQMRGSEHLTAEVLGPIRSTFAADYPLPILATIDRYRRMVVV